MDTCILCGGNSFQSMYDSTLKKCTHCGFVTANMEISAEILKDTYSINYFKGEEYMDYEKDKEILQQNFEKRIKLVKQISGAGIPVTDCFEIGCAYGFFGEVLLKHIKTNYKGIDVVPEATGYAKEVLKLDVMSGDYLQQPAPAVLYSDIFMWDVIEHLEYPGKFLKKSAAELRKGGRIYITTGDISSTLARLKGRNWRMIHPPSHIHYFSKKHLIRLLDQNGFSTVHVSYPPIYRSLRQIFYSLFLLKKSGKISVKLFNLIPSNLNIPFNTFDIILIAAVKN
ncbi:MAG TPA: class I SAM-dependent methyltransferase [Bacteroidales bacterium]|nr:class I SAM-dependent methyltransferase [Bacteroidales bacterium]